jgi:hypothetical protein
VLAEHLVAQLAELDQQLGPRARGLGVDLLLIEVAGRAIPVGRSSMAMMRSAARVGRWVGSRSSAISKRSCAWTRSPSFSSSCLADAEVHLDALLAVGREVGDARHVLDGAAASSCFS